MFKLSKSNNLNLVKIYEKAEDIITSVPIIKRRRKRRLVLKFLKYFSYSIIGLFLLLVILFSTSFFSFWQVYRFAATGKNHLEYAVSQIEKQKYSQAIIFSKKAENNFNSAFSQLEGAKGNFFINNFTILKYQLSDIEYLIKTAEIINKATWQGAAIGQKIEYLSGGNVNSSFSKFTREEKRKVLKFIYESGPELAGVKANLDLAYLILDKVEARGLLWPLKSKINSIKLQLKKGKELAAKFIPITQIVPALSGYPESSNFLVLLENSDELRPTGGFLGTYGIMEIDSGDISNFNIHDIYHLDMPVKDKINVAPPEPLKKFLGIKKWYMRDANWSPDWPTSAKKIEWFYKSEEKLLPTQDRMDDIGKNFNGIIAITPKVITDLLALTGPIIIEGEEYNKDNFVDLLEYRVEKGYIQLGIPSWHRKEVIGDIFKELKIKLFNLPSKRWLEIFNVVDENILEKNILVFFEDTQLQNFIKDLGGAGEVKTVNSDYLMIVDANMGALKTDAVMKKGISYNLEKGSNGIYAKLKIDYAHHGFSDWKTTSYKTYSRIYVPLGSQLVETDGLDYEKVEVSNEFGKTVFAAYISIEPGEIGSLYFEYKLPGYIEEQIAEGDYNLYIQKQPGNEVEELIVDLNIGNKVKSYSPTGFYVERVNDNQVRWRTDLGIDRKFDLNF
ncbi:MAG: DUF4012 domain-containing protein [Patescibacteria group bacterium]